MTNIPTSILENGNRWTNGNHDRIYIKDLTLTTIGLETDRYNSGNINSATVNGEQISNTFAREILRAADEMNPFYNVNTGRIEMRSSGAREEAQNLVREAAETLLEEIEEEEEEVETMEVIYVNVSQDNWDQNFGQFFEQHDPREYENLNNDVAREEMRAWLADGWAYATEEAAAEALEAGQEVASVDETEMLNLIQRFVLS